MIPPPSASAILAIVYTLIAIATVLIAARIYLRIKIQKRRLLFSDWLMILGWCGAFASAPFNIVLSSYGALKPHIDYSLTNYHVDLGTFKFVRKMIWASGLPLFTTPYFCKASLLAVYLQLFPPFLKKRRIVLWVTIGYVVVGYIVSMSLLFFLCFPPSRYWSLEHPENMCSVKTVIRIYIVSWVLHFSSSIAIFILPFLVIYNLQMDTKTRITAYCVLLLGLVDIAFCLTRFLSVQLSHPGDFKSITIVTLWNSLDIYIGLVVACLPALRPYLRRGFTASNQDSYSARRERCAGSRTRTGQSGFEEIDEVVYPRRATGVTCMSEDRYAPDLSEFTRDEVWDDDRKRNRSDVELVTLHVGPPAKKLSRL
ncbi:hypothetical protein B0T10DRAFT_496451 [Thelonectria olida]|uniref:Rhodopsin domain-containing protein n=1 Tax=Thelonectria olida TaxID=1576542 RepID=A0A9P9AMK5_9HYPO|nr:hypothetical protein B0T10DRAFT_496451 [Thelonectria olida]